MKKVGIAVLVGAVGLAGLSLLLWLVGLVAGFGGGLIHLLLVFALAVGPAGLIVGVVLILVGGAKGRRP
jgi:hypothetical protein